MTARAASARSSAIDPGRWLDLLMKVSLALHGGLAAAVNLGRPPRQLDTGALEPGAATELSNLVAAATAAAAPTARTMPDAMSYTITVEDGGKQTVLKQSDVAMAPAFAALLAWLQAHFAKK